MRDDRDDPFGEFFREFERMVEDMFHESAGNFHVETTTGNDSSTHIDVYEEDAGLRIIADLPGVEKDDIEVTCDGRVVSIIAGGERRSYDEQVRLPRRVDETSAAASYNNGVLEVTFDTLEDGHAINID